MFSGVCATGVGALCYYGLGLSNEAGAIDKARFWPQAVRANIKATYLYFAGSLGATAGMLLSFLRKLLDQLSRGFVLYRFTHFSTVPFMSPEIIAKFVT